MFKLDIPAETSVGQVSVTLYKSNTNRNVPTGFSVTIMFWCSWKLIQKILNMNRPKDKAKLIAALLYLFTECIAQHIE